MFDYSKRSDTEEFFSSVVKELRKTKIKSVFSLSSPSWSNRQSCRTYDFDTAVYILFENEMCLVIEYRFIDCLSVEYRRMNQAETDEYKNVLISDLFNCENSIHNSRTGKAIRTETCSLPYGFIREVKIKALTEEYSKWIDGNIEIVAPTDESFEEIEFVMDNGKSFTICAADTLMDGYTLIWSKSTRETLINL